MIGSSLQTSTTQHRGEHHAEGGNQQGKNSEFTVAAKSQFQGVHEEEGTEFFFVQVCWGEKPRRDPKAERMYQKGVPISSWNDVERTREREELEKIKAARRRSRNQNCFLIDERYLKNLGSEMGKRRGTPRNLRCIGMGTLEIGCGMPKEVGGRQKNKDGSRGGV